jgi:hypothetical protein
MENKHSPPTLFPHARRCKICGVVTTHKDNLCPKHAFLEGRIFTLDMEKWRWKREVRKIG